jgi:hypothetical protein
MRAEATGLERATGDEPPGAESEIRSWAGNASAVGGGNL